MNNSPGLERVFRSGLSVLYKTVKFFLFCVLGRDAALILALVKLGVEAAFFKLYLTPLL